ncbi:Sodium/hydrogen exchanger family-domain-containing protein [Infundibulicybe gibba]|nr:Sodium/hydrogen exchanger family-domain-containing protein [Infundibulicybe gibba]
MPEFSNTIISLFRTKREATEQGGLLSGKDPSAYNPSDPIRLWIIQVGVIVMTASLLSLGLRRLRQPMVIAEVLGGILLGPTAFGRIPGFTEHVFPTDSRPYLNLVANIGLCLFLFLVGLEIDGGIIKRNARLSATVALAGMILPFGFGAGLAVPLYHEFIDPSIKFTHFMLFTGVAYSITAFPVLCRILTELKLLDTTVGIVVLSAGVGNDIVGWTLLALSVALVNAGSGLTALWILMTCVGWTLFLLFPVKRALRWLARKTGSIEQGPTVFFMTVTILLVFGSAFFTDVIGVHAIFGAFVAGIIIPREGGLTIALTEKLEDMVSIIFLPLYFTLSGLSTDLGLLNNGITWAYTIAIMSLAFTGKFGGCTLAARYFAGFNWREASAIGSLMSCKGLVELIVLNVGLSAGILSQRVFSMFVLEALVLTFMTTPLVVAFYPPRLRVRITATGTFNNVADDKAGQRQDQKSGYSETFSRTRFTVVLDKLEHLPSIMALTQLIRPHDREPTRPIRSSGEGRSSASSSRDSPRYPLSIEALRLIELSDRVSAVMRSSASDTILHTDPLLAIFRMFGQLNDLPITPSLSIVPFDDLSHSVAEHAYNHGSEMIMLPWLPPSSDTVDDAVYDTPHTPKPQTPRTQSNNPFDALFKATNNPIDKSASALHSQFVRGVFSHAKTDVALFVDQIAAGSATCNAQHIFLPFFGGPDDRLALEFVVQLCENVTITATILRLIKKEMDVTMEKPPNALIDDGGAEEVNVRTIASNIAGFPDTVYGRQNTEVRMQSETADNLIWAQYSAKPEADGRISPSSRMSGRVAFKDLATPIPLHAAIHEATTEIESLHRTRLLVVTGRSRRLAVENHRDELKDLMEEYGNVGAEVRKTIGDVAAAFVVAGCGSGILVLQAATNLGA